MIIIINNVFEMTTLVGMFKQKPLSEDVNLHRELSF